MVDAALAQGATGARPNIVFVLCDNTGWGDFSCYGGSTPTPRIDRLAGEGMRFTNYTVESQCTPTRSAIMTGRQSVRSGTYKVHCPGKARAACRPGNTRSPSCSRTRATRHRCGVSGILARSRAGCRPTRASTSGGATRTASMRPAIRSYAAFRELVKDKGDRVAQDLGRQEGPEVRCCVRAGPEGASFPGRIDRREGHRLHQACRQKRQAVFHLCRLSHICTRRRRCTPISIRPIPRDLECTRTPLPRWTIGSGRSWTAWMGRGSATTLSSSFPATTGPVWSMSIVFWEDRTVHFAVEFFTPPWEGSMRVPAIVRFPGKVPAGVVTAEMLSAHDWYKTFAALAGASDKVPTDRPMDGVDASAFLLGERKDGPGMLLFFGPDGSLMSVEVAQHQIRFRYSESIEKPIVTPQLPMISTSAAIPTRELLCSPTKWITAGCSSSCCLCR